MYIVNYIVATKISISISAVDNIVHVDCIRTRDPVDIHPNLRSDRKTEKDTQGEITNLYKAEIESMRAGSRLEPSHFSKHLLH